MKNTFIERSFRKLLNYYSLFCLSTFLIFCMTLASCQKETDFSGDISQLQSSVSSLKKSTDSLAAALGALNINSGTLSLKIDSIKNQLSGLTVQISTLSSQLATANVNIAALTTQIAILNQQYAQLLATVNSILGSQKRYFIQVNYLYTDAEFFDTTQWHYVAVVFNQSRQSLIYIDGVKKVDYFRPNLNYSYSTLLLGVSLYTGYAGFYKGLIDELKVSNIARSQQEIQDYYTYSLGNTNPTQILDASTIGLWHFNENNGSSFANSVPNSTPGTLFGNTSFISGKSGNAIHFDGITGRGNCNLSVPASPLTIEFWFKSSTTPGCIIQPYGTFSSNINLSSN